MNFPRPERPGCKPVVRLTQALALVGFGAAAAWLVQNHEGITIDIEPLPTQPVITEDPTQVEETAVPTEVTHVATVESTVTPRATRVTPTTTATPETEISEIFRSDFRDEAPSLDVTGLLVRDWESLLNRFSAQQEAYNTNPEYLLEQSPIFNVMLPWTENSPVHLGFDRAYEFKTMEELLNLNFGETLANADTRNALLDANSHFNELTTTFVLASGEVEQVFTELPGSSEAATERLFVQAPEGSADDYYRSALVVEGSDGIQNALLAQFAGMARIYNPEWDQDQVHSIALNLYNNYMVHLSETSTAGYEPFWVTTNTQTGVQAIPEMHAWRAPWMVWEGIMEPDLNGGDRGDQVFGQQCITVRDLEGGENTNFPSDLDGASNSEAHPDVMGGKYTVYAVVDLDLEDGLTPSQFISAAQENAAVLVVHESDQDGFGNIPASYEVSPGQVGNRPAVHPLIVECAPAVVQPVQPTPVPPTPEFVPTDVPRQEETPERETETPEFKPTAGNNVNNNGETEERNDDAEDPDGDSAQNSGTR